MTYFPQPVNKAGDTLTGKINFAVSGTASAGINLGAGVAPTAPVDGDVWMTSSGIQVRINTVTYSLPLASAAQTITGAWSFSSASLTFGGGTVTGTIAVGTGATASGATKTVNVGTGGASGSTTNMTVGNGTSGATSNLLLQGTLGKSQLAITSKSTLATLTAAEVQTGIIQYTGTANTLTLPTGTSLDSTFTLLAANTAFDFSVINTGSGTATVAVNTGVTNIGALTVAAGASGLFRLTKTGTATYVLYRLS